MQDMGRVWLCLSKQNRKGRVADCCLLILAATDRKRWQLGVVQVGLGKATTVLTVEA
jgi:hypothetical protein